MKAKADADAAGGPVQSQTNGEPGPAEQSRHECKQGPHVDTHKKQGHHPVNVLRAELIAMKSGHQSIGFRLIFEPTNFSRSQRAWGLVDWNGRLRYGTASYQINCTHVMFCLHLMQFHRTLKQRTIP